MAVDLIFVATGWIGILVEFLRPGMVLPGVAGLALLILGYVRLIPEHATAAAAITAPFLAIAAWLLWVAKKARRNKRTI